MQTRLGSKASKSKTGWIKAASCSIGIRLKSSCPADSLLVLTDNYEAQEIHQEKKEKKIHFISIWQWLLRGSKKLGDMHQNL
jgi:hypothetical protein